MRIPSFRYIDVINTYMSRIRKDGQQCEVYHVNTARTRDICSQVNTYSQLQFCIGRQLEFLRDHSTRPNESESLIGLLKHG